MELRKPFLVRNQHATLRKISLPVSDSVVVKLNPKLLQILRRQCCLSGLYVKRYASTLRAIVGISINAEGFERVLLSDDLAEQAEELEE